MPSHIVEDKALSQNLSAGVTTEAVMQKLTQRYGRGWQSDLAEVLGLSSKTINDWMRKEKLPPLAQIAIGAILLNRSKIQGSWSVVHYQDEYIVCDTGPPVGRVVARVNELEDAKLIAATPVIKEAFHETSWVYESFFEEDKVAAQDATEEDAEFIDHGLTAIHRAKLATEPFPVEGDAGAEERGK